MTTVVESSQRAKRIVWMAFGLTVAAWLVAGGMRLTRPVIESVMNGGEETLMACWIVAEMIRQAAGLEDAAATLVVDGLGVVALLSFPAAVAVAVLKYRLYDIDRIISRTLAYAILVGLLGGAYLLAVLALQAALPISDDSPAIVAASTLVVAAAFGPLRACVKGVVDRRFNRAGYDAQQTVERFSRRLRTHSDLDQLQDDLLTVVGRTVDPSHVSVWFSHSEKRR